MVTAHADYDGGDLVKRTQLWLYDWYGYCPPQQVVRLLAWLRRDRPREYNELRREVMARADEPVPLVVAYLNRYCGDS